MQLPEKVISNPNVLKVTELPAIPEDFICALSREMFFDPVLADDGFTYEKEEIEQYIATCLSENKKITSPQTREEISGKLIQNKSMKSQVNSFLTKHPQHWENLYVSQSLHHQVLAKLDQANAKELLALIDRDPRLLKEVFKEKNDKTILELICSQPSKELLQQTIKKLMPKDKKDIIGFYKVREVFLFKLLVKHQNIDSIKMIGDILEWGHDFYVSQAYRALEEEDAKCLQTCLELGVSFKESSNNRPSLIHAVVIKSTIEMLEVICEFSEEALAYTEVNGNTLLHIAAQANVGEIVQYLLDKDLNPLALNAKQQTPLQVAAYNQSNTVLKLLLSSVDQYELLTLINSHHGKGEIANIETAFGWDQNFYQRQARKSITKNDLAILRLCCSMEIPIDAIDKSEVEATLLHLALSARFEAGAKFLLDAGALVSIDDGEGQTALHYAALYASESLLSMILHKAPYGLVMSKSYKLPIQLAIDKNREQPIIELFVKKFKPEEHNLVFILMSNYHGSEELKKIGNALGWNKDWYFKMACQAVERQNLKVLSFCLALGADITGVNESGDSLLHIAVRCAEEENTTAIAYLLEQGVNGKQVDAKGKRAQELALSLNKRSVAQFIEKKRREIKFRPFIEPLQEQAKQAELKLAEEQAKQRQLKQQLDKTENTLRDQQAFIERQSTALQVLKNVSSLSFRINPLIIKGRNHLIDSEENLEIIGLSAGRIVAINEKEEVQLWDGKTKQLIKSYRMILTLLRTQQTIMQELLKKAKDSNSDIRRIAVDALGNLKGITPEIIQVLLSAAKDNDSNVRRSAIKALSELKEITLEIVQVLLSAAKDNNWSVCYLAKDVLNKLEVITPEIMQVLLLAAKDNDRNVRRSAVDALGNLKEITPEIIQALLAAAKDDDRNIRRIAIETLCKSKEITPEIIQALLSAAKDDDSSIRRIAIEALCKSKEITPEIIQALLAATKDDDSNVCKIAVEGLGKLKEITPEIIQVLLTVAKVNLTRLGKYPRRRANNDSDQNIYRNVRDILEKLEVNNPEIIQALIAATRHEDSGIRSSALQALSKTKELTPEIIQALLSAAKDDDYGVRGIAIETLCKSKEITPEIIQALLSAAKDDDRNIRRIAIETLCKSKEITPEIIQALLAAVKDDNKDICRIAVEALYNAKELTPEIIQALLAVAKDDDSHSSYRYARTDNISVRSIIQETLSKANEIRPELIRELLDGASDVNDTKISKFCIKILIKLKSDKLNLMDYLIGILKDENNEQNIRCGAIYISDEMGINNPVMIQTLVEVLKDNDLQVRCVAIASLIKINSHILEAIQEILRISNFVDNIEDKDRNILEKIIDVLAGLDIKTPEVLQALINFSKGKDEKIRIKAIKALVELKANTPEVKLIILNLLKSYDQFDKYTIQNLINNLDLSITTIPEVANILLDLMLRDIEYYKCFQGNFIEKLNIKISEIISYLLIKLKDNNKNIICNAIFMLGELKTTTPEVIQTLLDTFKDHNNDDTNDNASVRTFVVNTFKKLKDSPITTKKVLESLKNQNLYIRCIAIHILFLAEINNDEIIKAMLGMIKDNDSYIRKNAIVILSKSKEATIEIIQALLSAAKDDDSSIRRIAIEALYKSKETTPEIIQALLFAAKDNDSSVRGIAIETLCKSKETTPEIIQALLFAAKDNDINVRIIAIETLCKSKEITLEIIQVLLSAAKDNDRNIRRIAIETLCKSKEITLEIIQVLLSAAKDNDWHVLYRTKDVLNKLEVITPELMQVLLLAAKDNDENVRKVAVEALGKSKEITLEIIQALLAATKDDDYGVRRIAIEALGIAKELTPEIIQALLFSVKDNYSDVRREAVKALGIAKESTPEIIQALLFAAKDNYSDVRREAVKALCKSKETTPEIIQALLFAAKDHDYGVRDSVQNALNKLEVNTSETLHILLTAAKDNDSDVRRKAVEALCKSKETTPEIIQALLSAAKDHDYGVRGSVQNALNKLEVNTSETLHILLTAAKDSDWIVRKIAKETTPEIMQVLLAELKNKYDPTILQIIIKSFDALNEIKNDLQEDYFLIEDVLLPRKSPQAQTFRN